MFGTPASLFTTVAGLSETEVIQGRRIGRAELQQIREFLAADVSWSRRRISQELARLWEWQNGVAQLKELAHQPLGSGAVESACRQYQCRCKRTGQFWTTVGKETLLGLETCGRNGRWQKLDPHAKPAALLN